jgi:hypothetical protein
VLVFNDGFVVVFRKSQPSVLPTFGQMQKVHTHYAHRLDDTENGVFLIGYLILFDLSMFKENAVSEFTLAETGKQGRSSFNVLYNFSKDTSNLAVLLSFILENFFFPPSVCDASSILPSRYWNILAEK